MEKLKAVFCEMYGIISILFLWMIAIFQSFLPRKQKNIQDEVVLITGAGSGIGRLMAYKFAELGAIVVCTDINKQAADETCNAIIEKGHRAFSYYLDVTNRHKVYDLAKTIQQEVGEVDILVNNAGIVTGRTFMNSPDEMIIKTMEVNVNAHFWTIKAFLGSMIKRNHGHIVSIASLAGHIGSSHVVDYCTSKFAAVGLMESIKIELYHEAPEVRTTTVCPFFLSTGMFEGAKMPNSPLFVWTTPEVAANEIIAGVLNNETDIFIPRYRCQIILFLKRHTPDIVARRMNQVFKTHTVMQDFYGRYGKKQN